MNELKNKHEWTKKQTYIQIDERGKVALWGECIPKRLPSPHILSSQLRQG